MARSLEAFLGITKEETFFLNLLFTFITFYDDDMESVVMTILCCSRSTRLSGEAMVDGQTEILLSQDETKKKLLNCGTMEICIF